MLFNERLNFISKIPQLCKIRRFNIKVLQNLEDQQTNDVIWTDVKSDIFLLTSVVPLSIDVSVSCGSDGDTSAEWLESDSLKHCNKCNLNPHYLQLRQ